MEGISLKERLLREKERKLKKKLSRSLSAPTGRMVIPVTEDFLSDFPSFKGPFVHIAASEDGVVGTSEDCSGDGCEKCKAGEKRYAVMTDMVKAMHVHGNGCNH